MMCVDSGYRINPRCSLSDFLSFLRSFSHSVSVGVVCVGRGGCVIVWSMWGGCTRFVHCPLAAESRHSHTDPVTPDAANWQVQDPCGHLALHPQPRLCRNNNHHYTALGWLPTDSKMPELWSSRNSRRVTWLAGAEKIVSDQSSLHKLLSLIIILHI